MAGREQSAIERVHEATVALAEAGSLPSLGQRIVESMHSLLGTPTVHLYVDDRAEGLEHLASCGPGEVAPLTLSLTAAETFRGQALAEALGLELAGTHLLVHEGAPIGVITWVGGSPDDALVPEILLAGFLAVASALLGARLEVLAAFEESERDPPTGLYSRGHYDSRLIEELSRAVRHERPLALLILAIDDFDGHRQNLANTLVEGSILRLAGLIAGDEPGVLHARDGDVAARLETSGFALLLPDTPKAGALVKADRVRAAIEGVLQGAEGRTITVSIGVAAFPEDAMDAEGLHDAAHGALASARSAGGNRVGQA